MSPRMTCCGMAVSLFLGAAAIGADEGDFVFRSYNAPSLPSAIEFVNVDGRDVVRMRSEGELPLFASLTGAEALYLPVNQPKLGDVTTLELVFKNEVGLFGGGTPRFFLGLDLNGNGVYDSTFDEVTQTWDQEDGNLMIHLGGGGNPPWQGDPGAGWQTGAAIFDLASSTKQYETGQVGGNTLGHTWADVQALINPYDGVTPIIDLNVVAIGFAVDGGWWQDADTIIESTDINSILVDTILFEGMTGPSAAFSEQVSFNPGPNPLPEPSSLALLAAGGMLLLRRRRA